MGSELESFDYGYIYIYIVAVQILYMCLSTPGNIAMAISMAEFGFIQGT